MARGAGLLAGRALRGGRWSLLGLALVVALGGGASITAAVAAYRTDHAYGDYVHDAAIGDLVLNPSIRTKEIDEAIRGFDGVETVRADTLLLGSVVATGPIRIADVPEEDTWLQVRGSVDGRYVDVDRPAVSEGRVPSGERRGLRELRLPRRAGADPRPAAGGGRPHRRRVLLGRARRRRGRPQHGGRAARRRVAADRRLRAPPERGAPRGALPAPADHRERGRHGSLLVPRAPRRRHHLRRGPPHADPGGLHRQLRVLLAHAARRSRRRARRSASSSTRRSNGSTRSCRPSSTNWASATTTSPRTAPTSTPPCGRPSVPRWSPCRPSPSSPPSPR